MDISFQRAGLTLRGKLEGRTGATQDLAILMHGFTADLGYTKDQLLYQLAARLNDEGIATLRFDFNGHGKSDGDFVDMTVPNEIEDATAALQYVQKLPNVHRVFVMGHSQGGVVASMLAGLYPEQIDGVVLMAPAATLSDDARRGRIQGFNYDPQRIPATLEYKKNLTVGGAYLRTAQVLPIYEVAQRFQGPVCLIHGLADEIVNNYASQHYDAVYQNSELHLLAGGSHGLDGTVREETLRLATAFATR